MQLKVTTIQTTAEKSYTAGAFSLMNSLSAKKQLCRRGGDPAFVNGGQRLIAFHVAIQTACVRKNKGWFLYIYFEV